MSRTGLVLFDRYMDHDTGPHHPERPARIGALLERMEQVSLRSRTEAIEPRLIDLSLVEKVHASDYISRVRSACQERAGFIDTPECPLCDVSFEIARLAAGGVVAAVDAVMAGRVQNVFCGVRPPGHHAERRRAMGFCYFNNVAIAAEYLRAHHGVDRVAIVDWDVHHGNGTQHHFERDPDVLYCSLHQDPRTLYPGTGFEWENGTGAGTGTTLNIPLEPGSGDDEYRRAFEERILPAASEFKPGFILVSAGFDAHRDDPLAHISLTTQAFGWMTGKLRALAESLCDGRVVSVLEGGYDLRALADSVQAHVEALAAPASA